MEPDRINQLLEKYWHAETNEAEEAELKEYFTGKPGPEDHPASVLFNYLSEQQQVGIGDGFDKRFEAAIVRKSHLTKWLNPLLKVAAMLVIAFSLLYILLPDQKPASMDLKENDTYDDPHKAYLETKKALLLISYHLSAGKNYMSEISKINKAEQLINTKADKK